MLMLTPVEIKTSDWYQELISEVEAIKVETVFVAAETILKGKHEIGKIISDGKSRGVGATELVQYLASDVKMSERELWYCVKFYERFPDFDKAPELASKTISWNKVKKLIAGPEKKTPCLHTSIITIKVCEDCGAKIKDEDEEHEHDE